MKVLATGGPVVTVAQAENARGGTWCSTDVIIFTPNFVGDLLKVNASGGNVTQATKLDGAKHTTHRWPWCLPDGKHFLYLATSHQGGKSDDNGVYFASLNGEENRQIVASDAGAQFASGYLLYHTQNSVMAQSFDPATGKLSGEPAGVLDKVKFDSGVWRALFTVANNGMLGYMPGGSESVGTKMEWLDRSGKPISTPLELASSWYPRLSPDGKWLAFSSGDPALDIWTLDLERRTKTRITFDPSVNLEPTWSLDGKTLAYSVTNVGGAGEFGVIHSKAASGSGPDQVLVEAPGKELGYPQYSPDGRYIVYLQFSKGHGEGIFAKPLSGGGAPIAVVTSGGPQINVRAFRISPNGRWIAYQSNESGRPEIYVAPFLHGEGKWQVSNGGGLFPTWRGDSQEIYYPSTASDFYAASAVEHGGNLQIGTPQLLFHVTLNALGTLYDVSSDGQRFLVNRTSDGAHTTMNLMTNWTAELKK
jgi:Tol biopolymer transport system component